MKNPLPWPEPLATAFGDKEPGSQAECYYELRHASRDFAFIRAIPRVNPYDRRPHIELC